MTLAEVSGFKLNYSPEGNPSHRTVVLSSSLGADTSMWDAQVEALFPTFRVLRYDTRGRGKSEIPKGTCTLADLGGDVITPLDVVDIEEAQMCGVSLGGMTAMWVGLHAPQRVYGLVLSNTSAKIGSAVSWNERISQVESYGLASIADGLMSRWFTARFPEREIARPRQRFVTCSQAGYLAVSNALRDADLRAEIYSIKAPTPVTSGASDSVTPATDGQALVTAIPGAIFRVVPGAHLSNIEESAAYN